MEKFLFEIIMLYLNFGKKVFRKLIRKGFLEEIEIKKIICLVYMN